MRIKLCLSLLCFTIFTLQVSKGQERESDFNFDWKFNLVEETKLPTELPLNDEKWRAIRLPHDWSVEASFSEKLEGCTGYLPGGVGLYQKHFKTPGDVKKQSFYVLFDGVYNNATFWLNGKLLGENPYGYSPSYFELTKYLKTDGSDNVLTVHVDHSRYADSRWYSGSGIYRNVKLVSVDKLHIPIWGGFVTTPVVNQNRAEVHIALEVENQNKASKSFVLKTKILNPEGKVVGVVSKKQRVRGRNKSEFSQVINIESPQLWNTVSPHLYKAETSILLNGEEVDTFTTTFGIRKFIHDKEKGLTLNGENIFVKGVCIHHDGGLVGAAVPKGVWRRRLEKLQAAGVNAIRTSHNPFSQEFLDLCDEMGMLVQAEIFDEFDNPKDKRWNMIERESDYITTGYTEHFQKWGESDLKRAMLRDRNHPAIFEWSIGNEIEWTYKDYKYVSGLWDPGTGGYWNRIPQLTAKEMKDRYNALPDRKYKLAETAKRLSTWAKEVDTTRPITANLIIPVASLASGYAAALDIVGFSYQINQYDWSKKNYPEMHFTGNENSGTWEEWNSIIEDPMVYSMYMWTGIDYMGEAHEKWPQKGWDGDILDFAGFEKIGWDHFKSIWVDEPHVAIGTYPLTDSTFYDALSGKLNIPTKKLKWNNHKAQKKWNYKEGELVVVEVPCNMPKAELFLNGKSLGFRSLSGSSDRILRWVVPFQPGVLSVKAVNNGEGVSSTLKTTTKPVRIKLTIDHTTLKSDGYDVAHVVAQLIDKDGNEVSAEEAKITFTVDGKLTTLGVDNGSVKNIQDFKSKSLETSNGKALLLVQSKRNVSGVNLISAKADGLKSNTVLIEVK